MAEIESQRIDRWLWHARVTKTRSLAQKLIASGKIRLDREKITNASHKVKTGNVLTITLASSIKILQVDGFTDKRGSFAIASETYTDLSPPPPKKKDTDNSAEPVDEGRPNKKQRREAIALKQGFDP